MKPPRGLRVSRLELGSDELAVFSFPLPDLALPGSLSEAEIAVARALLDGKSNAQIAEARRTSVQTVANQVASLMRKLNVHSRTEAFAVLWGMQRSPST